MADPKKYTVGWITAIEAEFIAACEFLDEQHNYGPASVQPNDDSIYALGKIGPHNVVIVTLPDSEYGTASVSRAAAKMTGTFPNIRVGLMVGIGGGVPSETNDIRLGDVVVSAARDGHGGVFQYDFGEALQNGTFKQTLYLNQPPIILRNAMKVNRAEYTRKGHRIREAVNDILEKNPRLKREFQRPNPKQHPDRLFRPEVVHSESMEIDERNLVLREPRKADEDDPAIHYGTIASGNSLMKDAVFRDKLAAERNVLCFEMEASGLVNHFPCLVIRGICDYSDSHINKRWQGYAAMTAAAYAKDILMRIHPTAVEEERTIKDVTEDMKHRLGEIQSKIDFNEQGAILDWLSNNNHSIQQRNLHDMRHQSTGQWFVESSHYQNWENTPGQALYCPGAPGVGKTVMASLVIDRLRSKSKDDTKIAFLYLEYTQHKEQTLDNLVAALLRQLAFSDNTVDESVKALYRKKETEPKPTMKSLITALDSVLSKSKKVFIVIDALDECRSPATRKDLLEILRRLQRSFGVNLFMTSRPDPKFTVELAEMSPLSRSIAASSADIEGHVEYQLSKGYPMEHQIILEAKNEILQAAGDVFLIAQLYLNLLLDRDASCSEELKQVLRELRGAPRDPLSKRAKLLKDVYDKTLNHIKHRRDDGLALRTLLWVTCTRDQMTLDGLQDALSIRMRNQGGQTSGVSILSSCLGLITIDPATRRVRFIHNTAHEYFTSTRKEHFPHAETEISKSCIEALLLDKPPTLVSPSTRLTEWGRSHPFYIYAASNWGYHACDAPTLLEEIMDFLKQDDKLRELSAALVSSWSITYPGEYLGQYSTHRERKTISMTGTSALCALHLVVFFGLEDAFHRLAESGRSRVPGFKTREFKEQLNHKATNRGLTPLHLAVMIGNTTLAMLLIKNGATTNVEAAYRHTPLGLANYCGHPRLADLLRKKGAKMKVENGGELTKKYFNVWTASFPRFG